MRASRQFLPFRGWHLVSDTEFVSHQGEPWVGRPQLQSPHNSRSQEVNVDPAHAAAMQVASADERGYVAMRDRARLVHPFVGGQKLPPASPVANEEFSIDQLMPRHPVETEESVQLSRVR